MDKIDNFSGEYAFLSNFYPCIIEFDGEKYRSVEHAYQAAKSNNQYDRKIIREAKSAGEAKKLGRNVKLRKDWENVKISVMHDLLKSKFSDQFLALELLNTGDADLIEVNTWGDKFWGQVRGYGKNKLGRLLMLIRKELKDKFECNTGKY